MNQTVCALGFDYRRKRSVLIIVVIIAPAACADFLTLGRRLVIPAHLALDCRHGFQFPWCVVPSGFDRCAFIEIKLLGVIRPDQVLPGEKLVCPEITLLPVDHPPMPFEWLGCRRFWRG